MLRVLSGPPFSESGHRYNFWVLPQSSGKHEYRASTRGFMPKVASVPKTALVMPVEIPAILRLQDRLVDLQLLDSVGEEASLTIPTVTTLHVGLA